MNRDASGFPLYHSESKKADLLIKEMPLPHALNAWRKEVAKGDTEVGRALEAELRARGCTLDAETLRWTVPAPTEVKS